MDVDEPPAVQESKTDVERTVCPNLTVYSFSLPLSAATLRGGVLINASNESEAVVQLQGRHLHETKKKTKNARFFVLTVLSTSLYSSGDYFLSGALVATGEITSRSVYSSG
jgi:type II secretory pathway component PulK